MDNHFLPVEVEYESMGGMQQQTDIKAKKKQHVVQPLINCILIWTRLKKTMAKL